MIALLCISEKYRDPGNILKVPRVSTYMITLRQKWQGQWATTLQSSTKNK